MGLTGWKAEENEKLAALGFHAESIELVMDIEKKNAANITWHELNSLCNQSIPQASD